jgi:lipopolysaccharide transport system ATP-binding protein
MTDYLRDELATRSASDQEGEVLVRVENVSKKFCRSLKRSLWYGLQDAATELTGRKSDHALRKDEFWAINNVSFELRRGECLGLIGRNGAGKTTLLRMLNGLIKPDQGRIEIRGKVGALIALGAGFNPILTGRENIYVNGSVLGLSQSEIEAKLDEIIDFAEIGDFIDAPVQSYSSGMQVRLGFAIATALSPDLLILDEILAVGDASFRAKCYRRIASLQKNAAVIFVSHQMDHVARICNRILVMSQGDMHLLGSIEDGVEAYEQLNKGGAEKDPSFLSTNHPIQHFELQLSSNSLNSGEGLLLLIKTQASESLKNLSLRIFLYNSTGAFAAACDYQSNEYGITLHPGHNIWRVQIDSIPLRRGQYKFGINIIDSVGDLVVWSFKEYSLQIRSDKSTLPADCQLKLQSWEVIDQLVENT